MAPLQTTLALNSSNSSSPSPSPPARQALNRRSRFFADNNKSSLSAMKTPERAEFEFATEDENYSDDEEYESDEEEDMEEKDSDETYSDSNEANESAIDSNQEVKTESDESEISDVEKDADVVVKMATPVTPKPLKSSPDSFGINSYRERQKQLELKKYLTPEQMVMNAQIERDPEFTSFKDSQLNMPLKTEVSHMLLRVILCKNQTVLRFSSTKSLLKFY